MRPSYKPSQECQIRRGIKRVELIVATLVVLFIGMLSAPALNSSLEASRQSQCRTNLRRLGRALQEYHAANLRLPVASTWGSEGVNLVDFPGSVDTTSVTYSNWAIMVLPHLEEHKLHKLVSSQSPIISTVNQHARATALAVMSCPSDSFNTQSRPFIYENRAGARSTFARGNFGINGGPQGIEEEHAHLMVPRPYGCTVVVDFKNRNFQWWGKGIAGFNKSFSFDEFNNGLGRTVALDELRAGIDPGDQRGAWALGQIASSVTWAHGILGDAGRPNPTLANADDILNGTTLHPAIGRKRIEQERMTFCDHSTISYQASSRSQHPGGVNVVFCDGAAEFIVDEVDESIWHAIHSRDTPKKTLVGLSPRIVSGDDISERGEVPNPSATTLQLDSTNQTFMNSLEMTFKLIAPGKFIMGLPDSGADDNYPPDVPPHTVSISKPFYMGELEVTQRQYERVMGRNPSYFKSSSPEPWLIAEGEISRRPVENLTWHEAVEFCQRLSASQEEVAAGRAYRLPSEAEWEYCCRSGSNTPYAFNSEWWDNDRSGEIVGKEWREDHPPTLPVGSYAANPFGLRDMRGNVWEWCGDWFRHDYYSWGRSTDPLGPATGMLKVYRGGDWIYTGETCKTGSRCLPPSARSPHIGFRVVCEATISSNRERSSGH